MIKLEEFMTIKLSGRKKLKYEKVFVKPVKCGCGMEMMYKALRCPGCETTL